MKTYSHSRISTYENCPLQFKFRYIDKPPVIKKEGIEAFLGSRIHSVFEKLHGELIFSKLNSLKDLLLYYDAEWDKSMTKAVMVRKPNLTKKNYHDTGVRIIEDYYKRYHPFNQAKTIGVEKKIPFKIKGSHKFIGYIDRLDCNHKGVYEIHDYKTSGTLPSDDRLQNDRQLVLYHIGVKQNFPDAQKVKLVWHYLVFDKELSLQKTDSELKELESETAHLIKTIESDTVYKLKESALCDYCDYPELCPAKKHSIQTQALPAKTFLKNQGVKLANRYVELSLKRKEIDNEIDQIRQNIYGYSYQENVSTISGSDYMLKISEKEVLKFPGSGEPNREKIEALLKKAGKWEEVSSLDTRSLAESIQQNLWDEALSKKIVKMGRVETERRISKSKIRNEDE